MGCASSKLDDLEAVALCRERCAFLDEAIHQRYALAEAHVAYVHSLKAIGVSLHHFFDKDLDALAAEPPSPVLNLPPQRKGDPQSSASPPEKKPAAIHHHPSHSHSSSGSHLNLASDLDDDDSGSDSFHHHSHIVSPDHSYGHLNYADHETLGLGGSYPGGGFMNMNFMKKQATPSVVYEQRPVNPQTVYMGEPSSSYFPYPYPNPQNPSSYPQNYYPNNNYGGGFFNSSPPRQYGGSSPPAALGPSSSASTSQPPPPPPPPPAKSSAWDFLNPFEGYEKYYPPPYTPSRDSREVREEEGIPDLEDEDFQQEVVKEVHGDQKFVDGGGGGGSYSKAVAEDDDDDGRMHDSDALYRSRPSASMENDPVEYEVHMVDKKVVNDETRPGDRGNVTGFKARGPFKGDSDVVREIQVQFERASESGNELASMLEIGKLPYKRKHGTYQASSKMLHSVTPSLSMVSSQPSTSKSAEANPAYLDTEGDLGLRSRNLSAILQELHIWEKKLYEQVKAEEKMRVLHDRKCKKLKHLDEKGAEAHKVDMTRNLVRSLSSRIRMAIQVVDKISEQINKVRDDNLWPQLNDFIQGLMRMWKAMLECHHNQCQAIREAKRLDAIASNKHVGEAHLEATLQLEREILNWTLRFSCWVGAQKRYVRALNSWLTKCLYYVPEETADGIAPFSPGRMGAPPIFVVCNQWSQALDRVSEKEVVESMRNFATSVFQLWERDKLEMHHKMIVSKDTEKKAKNLEREDQKIQKEIQAIDKRIVMVSGDENGLSVIRQAVYQSDTSKSSSLQVSLQHIFEAMERFAADSLKVYEELLQRIEEDNLAHESGKVA